VGHRNSMTATIGGYVNPLTVADIETMEGPPREIRQQGFR
jgi:hypothetical protein